jgi:hypothetical protein
MLPPIVIGLTGLAGAGKDTVADTLCTHAGFTKLAFADALRLEVASAYRLFDRYTLLSDRATKELPTDAMAFCRCYDDAFVERLMALHSHEQPDFDQEAWLYQPRSPRQILQLWGTEYRRAEQPNYWSTKVAMHIAAGLANGHARWVVTDCRFGNEVRAIRSLGGEIWQVMRQGLADLEAGHSSQTDGSHFGPAAILLNNGSITDLMNTALRMLAHRHGGLILPDDLQAAA